jgi:hypothetical protein
MINPPVDWKTQGEGTVMIPGAHRKAVVYIAGPVSGGDIVENVKRANAAGVALMKAGFSPIVPHGSCFWGNRIGASCSGTNLKKWSAFIPESLHSDIPYEDWISACLDIVPRCDAVLRLPGESKGADEEVRQAVRHGLPVFTSIEELLAFYAVKGR